MLVHQRLQSLRDLVPVVGIGPQKKRHSDDQRQGDTVSGIPTMRLGPYRDRELPINPIIS
jgi:hypothetical protein